jgi:opacity protein-like surface antigen
MKRLALALCLIAAPAYAADAPKPAALAAPQVQPSDPFTVTLTAAQWQGVVASLQDSGSVSARDASAIGMTIRQQVDAEFKKAHPSK